MCSTDVFLGLLALLFPPLPVWVKCGICSADSIINILLCMLGYLPGLLHAWYIIAKFPEPAYEYEQLPQRDAERAGGPRDVFIVVTSDEPRRQQQPKPQGGMGYGATDSNGTSPSQQQPQPQQQQPQPQPQSHGGGAGGEGPSDGPPPPSYAQVVAGDNKVQSQD